MRFKFKTFLLTVLLATAWWGISFAVGETPGDGAMPATAEVATSQAAATQATGPVVDPALDESTGAALSWMG